MLPDYDGHGRDDAKDDDAEDAEYHDDRGNSKLPVRNLVREMFVNEGRKSVVTYIAVSDPSEAGVTTTTVLTMNLRTQMFTTALRTSQVGQWL